MSCNKKRKHFQAQRLKQSKGRIWRDADYSIYIYIYICLECHNFFYNKLLKATLFIKCQCVNIWIGLEHNHQYFLHSLSNDKPLLVIQRVFNQNFYFQCDEISF